MAFTTSSARTESAIALLALALLASPATAASLRGRRGHAVWVALAETALPDDAAHDVASHEAKGLLDAEPDNAGHHALAQTLTATVRTTAELLDGEEEDAPREFPHEEEAEEGGEGAQFESDGDHVRTAVDDLSDITLLQRVGRRIDANNDTMLSADELHQFAQALRSKQWWDQTSTILAAADQDGDGLVSLRELSTSEVYKLRPAHRAELFGAADENKDGLLARQEMHHFLHPELGGRVLDVEVAYHFGLLDTDGDASLDIDEFSRMGHGNGEDFDHESGYEDFTLHDTDTDGRLNAAEFGSLLQGHELLRHSIDKAMESGDTDGDGYIHVDNEVPHQLERLLDSEFVEDFFFHKHAEAHHHSEL